MALAPAAAVALAVIAAEVEAPMAMACKREEEEEAEVYEEDQAHGARLEQAQVQGAGKVGDVVDVLHIPST